MRYSESTLKKLFGLSGNQCAFPDCIAPVIDSTTGLPIGQICHIKSKSPNGPRYDESQSEHDRNDYSNLLVMCAAHNKIVDDAATREQFPVALLLEFKRNHEARSHNTLVSEDKLDRLVKLFDLIQKGVITPARNRLKQLPAPPRDFTGREAELRELRQALQQRGVTISALQGLAGVGKTALALKLAHEFKDSYDAQIYLDLKGVGPQPLAAEEVMWHVISSFHPEMKRPDDADLPTWYNSVLNANRTLLLYDNAKDTAQIANVLPPEHCLLLITSRRHFTMRGMLDKNLDEMTEGDANELLLKIAPRIGGYATAIAQQCGYLPLALCAAASVLKLKRTLAPEDYLEHLRNKNERLKLRDDSSNLTVEASFGLSYELLNDKLQQRWRLLAVFPTDFDTSAAASVWQTHVDDATDSLVELEEYNVLEWIEASRRYRMHDLVRDYAESRLNTVEREQAHLDHSAHYLNILITAVELFYTGNEFILEGLSLFDYERLNIDAGQKRASDRFPADDEAALLCIGYAVSGSDLLFLRQHPRETVRWMEVGLSASRKLSDFESEVVVLGNLATAYSHLGEFRTAIDCQQQAVAIARDLGNRLLETKTLSNLGTAYSSSGEFRTGIDCQQQALAIAREINYKDVEYNALNNLGVSYYELGETQVGLEYQQQALAIAREIGHKIPEGLTLTGLGASYQRLGRIRTAIKHYQKALSIARENGDKRNVGINLANLGKSYSLLGKINKARKFMEEAREILEEIESPIGETVEQWLKELHSTAWFLRLRLTPLIIIVLNRLDLLLEKRNKIN